MTKGHTQNSRTLWQPLLGENNVSKRGKEKKVNKKGVFMFRLQHQRAELYIQNLLAFFYRQK